MSILWRSWVTFTAIIATVLIVLALLSSFQHNALYSDLIRQRLSVVAQTTAHSFQSVVNLGLPISMVRNARKVLARARQTDPRITAIHAFNPTGIIVQTTDPDDPGKVPDEVKLAQSLADSSQWSVETDTELYSGISIRNAAGTTVANIVVVYPKEEFVERTTAVVKHIATTTLGLLIIFSAAAYLLLRLRLSGPIHGLARLDLLLSAIRHDGGGGEKTPPMTEEEAANLGFLRADIETLEDHLHRATKSYDAAISSLGITDQAIDDSTPIDDDNGDGQAVVVTSTPETSLARLIARKLVPWAGLLIIGSALTLGILTIRTVNRSIEPEIANRTTLMGTVINSNIQRAVSAGVPLAKLVGAEQYFGSFLREFPEVAYIGVATGRIILEAGKRQEDIYGPRRSSKDVVAYPIESGGEQIGYIIIDVDTGYIAKEFENVLLDLAVVALVAVLLAFEVLVVMMSVSLTAPFNRLQHLVTLQAAGDFSKRIEARGKHAVDLIGARLSERAETLHRAFARAWVKTTPGVDDDRSRSLKDLASRFGLSTHRPDLMLFSYLNDIRLPLFLFAAADALPLAFFPLFTRAANNPLSWLDLGVVISLPLAGYLIAIMAASPYARPLAERFGHRKLILLAAGPAIAAHVGLYLSTNVIEIVLYRTVAGFAYAIVTLACQDYVLDVVPKEQRMRSLGIYSGVLFAGIFCGTAMGGVLADRLGQDSVFLVSAALVLVSGLLVYCLLPGRRLPQAAGVGSADGTSASIWAPLRSHRFSALVFGIAIPTQVLMQAFISYLVALYLHELGASVADIGRTLMVFFLMIALMGPTTARVTDGRFDPALVTVLGAILSGVSLLVGAIWGTQLGILVAVWGAGIGHGMVRGPQVSIAMTIAETDLARLGSNAVLGSLRTLERGGSIIGLVVIALLSSTIGYAAAIGVVGVWALVGVAAFMVSLAMSGGLPRMRRGEQQ
ncbi:MAG: MFS transporter [Gammaproteobacteria bacterium]|nr:MAG: MFS transporter [Gammaproteobacteria bacterium]